MKKRVNNTKIIFISIIILLICMVSINIGVDSTTGEITFGSRSSRDSLSKYKSTLTSKILGFIKLDNKDINFKVTGASRTTLNGKPAYSFSGDDYIIIPKTSALDVSDENAVTIAAWIKVNGPTVSGTGADVLGHTAGGMVSNPYMIRWHDVAKRFYFSISGGKEYQYVRSNVVKYGDVHHVAGTVNSNEICIYLDGVKICEPRDNTKVPNIAPTVRDLISGAIRPTDYLLNGDIGEVRVYSRALKENEIKNLAGYCYYHKECSQACTDKCPKNVDGCCYGNKIGQCIKGECKCIDGTSYCSDSPKYQVGEEPAEPTVTEEPIVVTKPAEPKKACVDTDDGKNYYVKGTISGPLVSGTINSDICVGDNLRELFCNVEGKGEPFMYTCPNGCKDGACIYTPKQDCNVIPLQDTDGDGCNQGFDSDCGGIEGVDDPSITCFNNKDDDCDGMIDQDDDDGSCKDVAGCKTDEDCSPGYECKEGTCIKSTQPVEDTTPPKISDVSITPETGVVGTRFIIKAKVEDESGLKYVKASYPYNNQYPSSTYIKLLDDGQHNDYAANDGIYARVWSSNFPVKYSKGEYKYNITASDNFGNIQSTQEYSFKLSECSSNSDCDVYEICTDGKCVPSKRVYGFGGFTPDDEKRDAYRCANAMTNDLWDCSEYKYDFTDTDYIEIKGHDLSHDSQVLNFGAKVSQVVSIYKFKINEDPSKISRIDVNWWGMLGLSHPTVSTQHSYVDVKNAETGLKKSVNTWDRFNFTVRGDFETIIEDGYLWVRARAIDFDGGGNAQAAVHTDYVYIRVHTKDCVDLDGEDKFEKSNVEYDGVKEYEDYCVERKTTKIFWREYTSDKRVLGCVGDNCYVNEAICSNDKVKYKKIKCEKGCNDGKCSKTICQMNTKYPVIDSPCTEAWPTEQGQYMWINGPFYDNTCNLFEVCSGKLDYVIDDAIDCCTNHKTDDICKFALENSEDNLKKCKGLYIIQALGSGAKYMKGYFASELCCAKTDGCGDESLYGKCEQSETLDNLYYKTYINEYASQLSCRSTEVLPNSKIEKCWVSDTDMGKNNCFFSNLPAHVSLNILETGTCSDYAIVLTTLLRKAGYSHDEVMYAGGTFHGYNLVKFPGDDKYHVVDTTGNKPVNIEFNTIPPTFSGQNLLNERIKIGSIGSIHIVGYMHYDYCNLMWPDDCWNDVGNFDCPPQSKIYGCGVRRKFAMSRCSFDLNIVKAACNDCWYEILDPETAEACCRFKKYGMSYKKCVPYDLMDM